MCGIEVSDGQKLRLLEETDADELYAVVTQNRDGLARWLPWASAESLEDVVAFVRRTREQVDSNGGFQAALVEDGRIVGMVGFTDLSWQDRSARIGYWLAEWAQGRGTMTRAVGALVDHALRTWQLDRVEIQTAVDNERSRAVPERLGFRLVSVVHDRALYRMDSGAWSPRG